MRARTRQRDANVVAIAPRIDKVTQGLEDRILGIASRQQGGEYGVVGSVTVVMYDYIERLSKAVERGLRDVWDWSWMSATEAIVQALPMRYWLVKLAPVGRLPMPAIESTSFRQEATGQGSPVALFEELDWFSEYERILAGEVDDAEARELVRQFEFPPPSAERVNQILEATEARDGLSAMERIKTVEASRIPELQQLIVESFSAQAEGKASLIDYLSPRLRELVGNDPGKSTGMNYRARRIARTEGVRISQAGLDEAWDKVPDGIIDGKQWFSALVPATRPDHAALHEKIFRKGADGGYTGDDGQPMPPIPLGPNCLCWDAVVLADDLTAGLPPENLGAWYDDSVLRAAKEAGRA